MTKIGIIGSGTWGTALANLLANAGHDVTLCSKFQKDFEELSKTRIHRNLPGTLLNENIHFTYHTEEAVEGQEIVVFAAPSIYIRETAEAVKGLIKPNQIIVNVAKGIEDKTFFTMSEVINDVLGEEYVVVSLSGPTHAEEVVKSLPTCITAASSNREARKFVQKVFSNGQFRVYTNSDPKGVEIAAASKNIIALACGVSDGLGYGDNAKAALITRGLFEITNLGRALGCDILTFSGLSGLGDIVVTAISNHSRNHNAGYLLGKGHSLEQTLEEVGMVVEGVNSLKSTKALADSLNIEMPIVSAVYDIVFNKKPPLEVVNNLFERELVGEKIFTA